MRMQRSLDQVPDQFSPADRIDLVCDKFEQACRRGEAPQIEEFLDVCDASERELLLTELLLVDREFRIKRGERADRIEYLQRFPEYSTVIGELDFATIADPGYAAKEPLDHRSFLRSGDRVADFELLEELGSGASGTVWKAHDPRLCRTVALKLPRSSRISAAERERFLREGRAAAQLRHPNIVAVHEADEKHGQAFIATEYIAGADLRQWLRKKCPSPAEAAELTSKLAEALQHAHERNVIHRDLKPANILIDRWGQPYIADFGLAKWSSDGSQMTLHGHVLGTPAYMSPEQARGDAARVDRRSDVYGLGALFYRTLTGRPPFEGDSATIIHAAIHDDPPPPRAIKASVPRDLETICLKAMEKEPSRRFASTDEMATDLQRFLRGEPILARRASIAIRSWNWLRRHAAAVALILLALFTASSLGMVRMLARENRELLGLQTVTLTTDPPGAKVAFVPLSESTGELLPSNAIFARGETPVREELQPGDYSVVAVLSDGRFHEVFRHVPDASEQTAAGHNHRFWKRGPNDTVQLSGIKIPGIDVTHSMVLIEGQENFQMGVSASSELPQHTRRVASFYVDPFEFTFGEYRRLLERLPFRYHDNPPADDEAVYASYDEAVSLAESVGKRLPTELEYEFAATARGTSRYPWGDAFPQIVPQPSFGPVGTPQFDRLSVQRPVYGLCSGKAEWTCSWAIPYPPYSPADPIGTRQEIRVFRGGDFATVEGNPRMTPAARDPRRHYAMNRHEVKPGLGFRCVRSFTPLFAYDEIP